MEERSDLGVRNVTPVQLILYSNDATSVQYSNGSCLELSPCGSSFQYYCQEKNNHLRGFETVKQKTEYTISNFRPYVMEALDFRNRFGDRPFVCRQFYQTSNTVRMYADIVEVAWPENFQNAHIELLPGGRLRLLSHDEYASLTLPLHKRNFTVQFLSKISSVSSVNNSDALSLTALSSITATSSQQSHIIDSHTSLQTTVDKNESHYKSTYGVNRKYEKERCINQPNCSDESIPSLLNTESSQLDPSPAPETVHHDKSQRKWDYIWMAQHFSMEQYPPHWKHPVQLLLKYLEYHYQRDSNCFGKANKNSLDSKCKTDVADVVEDVETHTGKQLRRILRKDFSQCVYTPVPASLPLNCKQQHKHKWTVTNSGGEMEKELRGRIKVICYQGIIYRLFWEHPRFVEIYPGDGSVITSCGVASQYFTHYILDEYSMALQKRTYCLQSLPPSNPDSNYNISKLLLSAKRFIDLLSEENLQLFTVDELCCWKETESGLNLSTMSSTTLLEESVVEQIGRFSVYSNGHIRVLFNDRTSLDMVTDLTKRLGNFFQRTGGSALGLQDGTCRLMLRNGHYHIVPLNDPGRYEKYVKPALEWAAWVNTVPSNRYLFYKDTVSDPEKQGLVGTELKKIRCFNYIIQNTGMGKQLERPFRDSTDLNCATSSSLTEMGLDSQTHDGLASTTHGSPGEVDMRVVCEALRRTSAFLRDA